MKRVFGAAGRAAAGGVVVKNWSSSIAIKLQSGQNTDEDRGHASSSSFTALLPLLSPSSIPYSLLSTPLLCLLTFLLSFAQFSALPSLHPFFLKSFIPCSLLFTFSIPCLSFCLDSPLLSRSIHLPFFRLLSVAFLLLIKLWCGGCLRISSVSAVRGQRSKDEAVY